MDRRVLGIELSGEWEQCAFRSRTEALTTFQALANDYESHLMRAILVAPLVRDQSTTEYTVLH